MNRDKACLHPLVWPDECGHGAATYIGEVPAWIDGKGSPRITQDVYLYDDEDLGLLICMREGSEPHQFTHLTLAVFWLVVENYPPWHPARDLLLSQGFAP